MPTICASATVPCHSVHTASAILSEYRILVDSCISYVDCITSYHRLSGRKQYAVYVAQESGQCSTGSSAWGLTWLRSKLDGCTLIWGLDIGRKDLFPTSLKLFVGRPHFLVTVEFTSTASLKLQIKASERRRKGERRDILICLEFLTSKPSFKWACVIRLGPPTIITVLKSLKSTDLEH